MDILIITLSFFLFAVAIFLYRKSLSPLIIKLFFGVLFFFSIALYLFYGIADYFTGDGITDAVIYHINYGLQGAGFLEYWKLILTACLIIIISLVFSYWVFLKSRRNNINKSVNLYLAFFFMVLSLFFNPAVFDLYNVLVREFIDTNFGFATVTGAKDLVYFGFDTYYKDPYIEKIGNNKNLVVIYAESLEQTYSNESIFPNLTKRLNELQLKSTYFTNIKQVIGTEYTISGVVASQCGIPLFSSSHGNSMFGMDEFLPLVNCFGDLLHQEGYYLSYYGGADLSFAGKGKFYNTHKFDEVNGFVELLDKLEDKTYKNGWGLYDDSLFDLSYERFVELSETKDKFAFFLLTLDTHHPNGQVSESCLGMEYEDGSNPILNAVACSDYLITEFVNKIMQSPYADETVVVVASDHLAMRNTASKILQNNERNNRFMIIDSDTPNSIEIDKLGSTLDIGSTVLPFIGYKGTIGLGRNLLDDNQATSEIEYIHNMVSLWKSDMAQFFDFPKIENYIAINVHDETVQIENRTFKIPIIIELNSNFETSLKFQFNLPDGMNLLQQVKKISDDKSFLLINHCEDVKELDNIFLDNISTESEFCLIYGKGEQYHAMLIEDDLILTLESIKYFINLLQ